MKTPTPRQLRAVQFVLNNWTARARAPRVWMLAQWLIWHDEQAGKLENSFN